MKSLLTFSVIFILMIFCRASAQQQEQFTLPNLGINTDSPNCDNVDSLITAAQNDNARLSNLVNQDLVAGLSNIQSAQASVQQACSAQSGIQSLSLLEAQLSTKGRSVSKLRAAIEKAAKKLASKEDKGQLYTDLISPKTDELSESLLQFTQAVNPQSPDFSSLCSDLQADLQELLDYLNFLSTQVAQVLRVDLPQRTTSLNSQKAVCDATPITQTGLYQTNFFETNNQMQQTNQAGQRVYQATVTFKQPFYSVPSVAIAPYGFDLDVGTPRFQIAITSVTQNNFVIQITATPYTRIYNLYISYFATISSRSGIYIINDSIDAVNDPAVKKVIQAGNSGMRSYTKPLNVPVVLPNAKSAIFGHDFNFGSGQNIRLDLTSTATSVTYSTWDSTVLNSASATILYWSGADNSVVTQNVKSTYNGPLTNNQNQNTRSEQSTFSTSNYLAVPEKFFGFTHIDFGTNHNFRLNNALSGSNSQWTYAFSTWSDSVLYQAFDTILFACTLQDKSKCVKSS